MNPGSQTSCAGAADEGWVVETAQNAEDGLALLNAGHYDVVLLDVLLPGMSGDELCRHLRAIRNDVRSSC